MKLIKKNYALLLFLTGMSIITAQEIELSISGAQQAQMPLAIIVLDEANNDLNDIATTIRKDLQFTDQFKPCITKYDANLPKKLLRKRLQNLGSTGTPIALCISSESQNSISWRLYDTVQCSMICGKKYTKNSSVVRGWAHAIADEAWKTLTGNDGFFSSRIAYCKTSRNKKGHTIKKIYIADFDGSNEELLVDLPTLTIAPRWHPKKPSISYSEYADTNVELMSMSIDKKRKRLSNFDGVNMLASFSPNGKAMTYCSSRGSGSCQIYLMKDNNLKRCTNNTGNNSSPIFIDEDHLCFCSNFQTNRPQIYIANIKTGHLQRITKGGYCTSPSYCKKNKKIAYHAMINGAMQVMIYDCATKTHTQLTKSGGNKHEVSWSPCGTQLLFVHEIPQKNSRLSSFNLLTNKSKYVTSANDQCSYSHWGPIYPQFCTTMECN